MLGLAAALMFSSCEDFLDSENYTGKDSGNYPKTEEDVAQMVSSVYKATFYQQWQGDYGKAIMATTLKSILLLPTWLRMKCTVVVVKTMPQLKP